MADSGYKAGTYDTAEIAAAEWDGTALADAAGVTGDAIDNSVAAARVGHLVSVGVVEDNTGAIDGEVTIGILGTDADEDEEGYQTATDPIWSFNFTPIQNAEVIAPPFVVYGDTYPKFKVYVYNDSGQELAVTVNICPITLPAAA